MLLTPGQIDGFLILPAAERGLINQSLMLDQWEHKAASTSSQKPAASSLYDGKTRGPPTTLYNNVHLVFSCQTACIYDDMGDVKLHSQYHTASTKTNDYEAGVILVYA